MRTQLTLLMAAIAAACSPATPPISGDPASESTGVAARADLAPPPVPSSATAAEPTAVPSASSLAAAASSSPAATVYKCDELVKLCHDVGHSGGETGRCHELGHAHDEGACATGFDQCRTACEAAAKKAKGHKHAH